MTTDTYCGPIDYVVFGLPSAAPPAPLVSAAAPAASAGDDTSAMLEQLVTLGQSRDAGVLTEAEFGAPKQRILAGRP